MPEDAPLRDSADVESALAELWNATKQPAAGQTDTSTASRVSVANLIVVVPSEERERAIATLAELSPVYPTRSLVVLIDQGGPSTELRASVSAICRVPEAGGPEVCCEQIVLHAAPSHVNDLDHTLLALLESDVPVMGWWRFAPTDWPGLFSAMRSLCGRLILDAGLPTSGLDSTSNCAVRELGWYRSYPWRELLARTFDEAGTEVPRSIQRLRIETSDSLDDRTNSLWLVGFTAGQLGWRPWAARKEPDAAAGKVFEFAVDDRFVRVELAPAQARRLEIVAGKSTFEWQCGAEETGEFRIITCDEHVCQMPRTVHVQAVSTVDALAAALSGRPVDAAFERAWPIAAWMAAHL